MRPPRPDIAVPPWTPDLEWIGGDGRAVERLTARGPVLVHFFDFAQLNSIRSLPYVLSWTDRYAAAGLSTVGVHSPRFPFTRSRAAVVAAIGDLGIRHPVAVDSGFRAWRDYGCHGWPSLFLWGRGGALRWYHLGEGEYVDTELAIREALEASSEDQGSLPSWPAPMEPVRPGDEPGAEVVVPTDELFPGGSPERPWRREEAANLLRIDYAAGGAYASIDGSGSIRIVLDDGPAREIEISGPGLVELTAHVRHEEHALQIDCGPGPEVYSVSFAPGVP